MALQFSSNQLVYLEKMKTKYSNKYFIMLTGTHLMKLKWLLIGIFVGVVLQFIVNGLCYQTIHYTMMELFSKFANNLSLATLIGFFYLHVPESKRSLQSGLTIGAIIGLLLGLYQFFDTLGSLNPSVNPNATQIIRIVILCVVCGSAISFSELKLNPNRN